MRQIEILDSSLRDGAQAEGIFYSLEDKLRIAYALDHIGIRYIEAGNPASNPKDMELFRRIAEHPLQQANLVAFGATRKPGVQVQEDAGCAALMGAGTEYVSIFGKSWDLHVAQVLKTSLAENLQMIRETISYFSDAGKKFFLMRSIFSTAIGITPLMPYRRFWRQNRPAQCGSFYAIPMAEVFHRKSPRWWRRSKRPAMCRWGFIATTIWTVRWRRASWRLRLVANRCRELFWDMGSAAEMPICRPLFQRCS